MSAKTKIIWISAAALAVGVGIWLWYRQKDAVPMGAAPSLQGVVATLGTDTSTDQTDNTDTSSDDTST